MRVVNCEYDNEMRPISVTCEDDGDYYSFDLIPMGEWIEDGYNDIPCVCSHCGGAVQKMLPL